MSKISARHLIVLSFFVLFFGPSLVLAQPIPANRATPTRATPTTVQSTSQPAQGSASFQKALSLLDAGKADEAYILARGFSDDVERRTIQWAAIHFGDTQLDYSTIKRFAADAPAFDSASTYRARIEKALAKTTPDYKTVIDALGGAMPFSLDAQIALANAYIADGQTPRATRIVQSIWVNNFLSAKSEQDVITRFSKLLTNKDHWDRAVHLLMHDRASGAERLLTYLSSAQKTLAHARIAVARKDKNAQSLIDQVDPSLRDHPLFHFTRAQFARDNGQLSAAVGYLNQAKGNFVDAAEFWYERRLIVRRALADQNYELAYKAAADYTYGPEGRVVEAQFHAGWVAHSFLKDPARARGHFEKMIPLSTLPDSITQAQYWLGQSLTALGDKTGATQAYRVAATYGSTFYGQLSREALGQPIVTIRPLPEWRGSVSTFDAIELVRAIKLLGANKKIEYAQTLMRRLIYNLDQPGHYVLAARLAQDVRAHHLAILIADMAEKRGVPLDVFNYPKDGIPAHAKMANVDAAAVYAIARQESKFDLDAQSGVGARGLMQLMPATAKEVAGKLGISYEQEKLTTDGAYNVLLGSTYLGTQLDRFDGSLILAAAAYNAGGGNVNKWLKAYGDPTNASIDPVSWIETIPFIETRKYVQRVMGNYHVYRSRLNKKPVTMRDALRRIAHD